MAALNCKHNILQGEAIQKYQPLPTSTPHIHSPSYLLQIQAFLCILVHLELAGPQITTALQHILNISQ